MGLIVGRKVGLYKTERQVIKRRQQDKGIMMWAGIYSDKLIRSYKVDD